MLEVLRSKEVSDNSALLDRYKLSLIEPSKCYERCSGLMRLSTLGTRVGGSNEGDLAAPRPPGCGQVLVTPRV